MSSNKSPGIDGLPVEFYSKFFQVIGPDLLEVYNCIFSTGVLSESQRTGVVTLLPKPGDPLDPSNRRPISLLTVDYKIIAKVLQLRMSPVMKIIVNQFQTCSVPGRSIHNNLGIIRDIIDFSNSRDSLCAIISIDQHKAFDKVNWHFMFRVLERMNFGNNFRKWVSILYNNIFSRLLINGSFTDKFDISRGVRQGCPLSPALYVLFIEPLARFISQSRDIIGFPVPGGGGMAVKFLQYADDATCVATSQRDILFHFKTFELFKRATGTSLNLTKTHGLRLGAL